MQNQNTFIFIPIHLKLSGSGCLEGFHYEFNDSEAFYITNNSIKKDPTQIIGYVDSSIAKYKTITEKLIYIDNKTSRITILNANKSNMVQITYDLVAFTNCDEILTANYSEHFRVLTEYLQEKQIKTTQNGRKTHLIKLLTLIVLCIHNITRVLDKFKPFLLKSATLSHLYGNLQTFEWLIVDITNKKTSRIQIGNIVTSKLIDIIIGVFLLKYFIMHQNDVMVLISETCEMIIENLKELLTYLMGSPIGLKLNKAFNNCLGTFFFHHISLWRIFLHSIHPLFEKYSLLLVVPGTLGFSYQLAVFSDILSMATFHVYCIYVYAARLINLQLGTVLSLFRLFIGHKYNPLRQRVDSYQYSHHQLFIGVLGFTILLFLLPTTLLYYTVFTIFRLLIVMFEWILHQIRFILDHLPAYILLLWLCNSSELAGTLYLKWQNSDDSPKFEAQLNRLSLLTSVKKFILNNDSVAKKPWGIIIKKIVTGVLI